MLLFILLIFLINAKNVLIVYSGGTIGMKKTPTGWAPESGYLQSLMKNMTQFQTDTLPLYEIYEMNPLLDSSAMKPTDWVRIGNVINSNYNKYDAFIVLHGTDTMAYSASALSFMFENLNKTVIITGSQTPLCEPFTDATNNILASLITIRDHDIPEVVQVFGSKMFRGNRIQKITANSYVGFDSGNYPTLAMYGAEFLFNFKYMRNFTNEPFKYLPSFSDKVVIIHLHPGISPSFISSALSNKNIKGAILYAFGAGNGPSDEDFLQPFIDAINRGVIVVDITQCHSGAVDLGDYDAAYGYKSIGVLSGYDMTLEAAYAKLSWLIGQGYTTETIKDLMTTDLRGEITTRPFEEHYF